MADKRRRLGLVGLIVLLAMLGVGSYFGKGLYHGAMTIHELLTENNQLKKAISNLTEENQIGYAKVVGQESRDGELFTRIKFVETARGDKLKRILEREYTIPGDVIHFDALIVKFDDQMVMDGKGRSLYLWRRIYGDKMRPEDGFDIEEPGCEPQRYEDMLATLPIEHRELFWTHIWDLANDPEKLKDHGIVAIYGNVVYSKLQQGLIYTFEIDATGQVHPEVIPDI